MIERLVLAVAFTVGAVLGWRWAGQRLERAAVVEYVR